MHAGLKRVVMSMGVAIAALLSAVAVAFLLPGAWMAALCGGPLDAACVERQASWFLGVGVTVGEANVRGWSATRTPLPSFRLGLSRVDVALGPNRDRVLRITEVTIDIGLRADGISLSFAPRDLSLQAGPSIEAERLVGSLRFPSRQIQLESRILVDGAPLIVRLSPGRMACEGAPAAGNVLSLRDPDHRPIATFSYATSDSRFRPQGRICLDVAAPAALAELMTGVTGLSLPILEGLGEPVRSHGQLGWQDDPNTSGFVINAWSIETGDCRLDGSVTGTKASAAGDHEPALDLQVALSRVDFECLERRRPAGKRSRLEPVSLTTQCEPLRQAHDFFARERVPGRIGLSIDELEWQGESLREVDFVFIAAPGSRQARVNARLPGGTKLKLDLSQQPDRKGELAGNLEINAPALQQTLSWLGLVSRESPIERIAEARLSADVAWRERRFSISDARLRLGDGAATDRHFTNAHFGLALDCERAGVSVGEALLEARIEVDAIDVLRLAPSGAARLRETLAEGTRVQGLRADLRATIIEGQPSMVRVTSANVRADGVDMLLRKRAAQQTDGGDISAARASGGSVAQVARLHSWILHHATPTGLEAVSSLKGPLEEFLSAAIFRQVTFAAPITVTADGLRLHAAETPLANLGGLRTELAFGAERSSGASYDGLRITARAKLGESRIDTLHFSGASLAVGLLFRGSAAGQTLEALTIDETRLTGDSIDRLRPGALPSEIAAGGSERRISFAIRGNLHADVAKNEARMAIAELTFGDLVSLRDVDARIGWKDGTFSFSASNSAGAPLTPSGQSLTPECTLARPAMPSRPAVRLSLSLSSGSPAFLRRLNLDAKISQSGALIDGFDLQTGSSTRLRGAFTISLPTTQSEASIGGCLAANLDPRADLKAAVEAFPDVVPEAFQRFALANDQTLSLEAIGSLKGAAEQVGGPVSLLVSAGRVSASNRSRAVLPTGSARLVTNLVLERGETLRLSPLRRSAVPKSDTGLLERLAGVATQAQLAGQNCRREPCTMRVEVGDLRLSVNLATPDRIEVRIGRIALVDAETGGRLELGGPPGQDTVSYGPSSAGTGGASRPMLLVALESLRGSDVRLLRRLKLPIEQLLPSGGGAGGQLAARLRVLHLASWDALAEWFGLTSSMPDPVTGIRDFVLTYETASSPGAPEAFSLTGTVLNGAAAAVAASGCSLTSGGASQPGFGRLRDGSIDLSGTIERIGQTRKGSAILAVKASGQLRCVGAGPTWNLFLGRSNHRRPVDLLAGHLDELIYSGRFKLGDDVAAPGKPSLLYLPGHTAKLTAQGFVALQLYSLLDLSGRVYGVDTQQGLPINVRAAVDADRMTLDFWSDDPAMSLTAPPANVQLLPRRIAGSVDWSLATRSGTVVTMARSNDWVTDHVRQCSNRPFPRYVERSILQCRESPATCNWKAGTWRRPVEKSEICKLLTEHPDLSRP